MHGYKEILNFWFEGEPLGALQMARWWQKNKEQDDLIRQRFSVVIEAVFDGRCDEWLQSPEGRLAAIICLDQFPRNIYRGDARSFNYDERALSITQKGIELGQLKALSHLQQCFFLMPLMHSELLSVQNQCVEAFTGLSNTSEGEIQKYIKGSLKFAIDHRDIVARFGRFPHRNEI